MSHDDTDHQPLVHRYRPRKFKHVVGQEHATTELQGMLLAGKVSRVYLITGPFGDGKTTLARILAKTLNCRNVERKTRNVNGKEEAYLKYEACDKCDSCKRFNVFGAVNHPDFMEINACSERGIESIRTLNSLQQLSPSSRFKVILIDEAHGLTGPAASAALKMLEEPAKRSVFILCTTNPEKILPTIASRCKRISLNLVSVDAMTERLSYIAEKENFAIKDEDARKIAEMSRGHVRDAVEMLEKVIHFCAGRGDSPKKIAKILPEILDTIIQRSPSALVEDFLRELFNGEWNALSVLARVDSPEYFFQLTLQSLKGVLFVKKVPSRSEPYYRRFDLERTKRKIHTKDLVRLYGLFLDGYEQLKRYVVDSKDALDNTAMRAIEYTSQLDERNERHSKTKEPQKSSGSLAHLTRNR